MKKIGLTTTVPIEVLFAAGYHPVDLNNLFITSGNYSKYIDIAEKDGFPKNMCAWIKGIYGAVVSNNIKEIVGVLEGDCSNTKVLVEVLTDRGIKVYPFSFPHSRKYEDIKREIQKFMELFDVSYDEVETMREELNIIRKMAAYIDEMTYIRQNVTGFENHLYQVNCSDFTGDFGKYKDELGEFINLVEKWDKNKKKLRVGYIGVPPMTGDLYDFIESYDAKVVYNEVQREFSFPRHTLAKDIAEQYMDYTYPYDIWNRVKEIKEQIKTREIDVIIHYTQAFCHKAVEDIIIKKEVGIPVLNIEGDKLNMLDARTKLRLEAFLDMAMDLKEMK